MRGLRPATGINSPQRGGVHNPLRASLARSPPRLGRSQAGGLHPRPPGLRPWRAFAHRAPAASATQPEGSGHGCDGGGGGQPLAVVHARRLAPPLSPGFSFSKARQPERGQAAGFVHRRASVPAAAAVGRPRHRPQGGCPTLGGQRGCPRPKRATGQSASATRHPVPARRRLRPM